MLKKIASISVYSIFIQLFGLISSVLVARMLGAEGRGELAVIMMWPSIIASTGLLGVDIVFARKGPSFDYYDVSLYKTAVFFAVTLGVAFALIGYFLLPYILSKDKLYLISFAEISLLFIPSSMLTVFLYSIALGRGNIKRYNIIRLIFPPLYVTSLFFVLLIGDVSVANVIYSFVFSSTITGLLVIGYSFYECRPVESHTISKIEILRSGLPFGISSSIFSFSTHLPTILLAALVDVKIMGLFVVAYVVSAMHTPFGNAIGKMLFSEAIQLGKDKNVATLASRFRLILLVYALVVSASLLVFPFVLPLLYGKDFFGAVSMLNYLIPATSVMVVTGVVDDILKGYGISKPGIFARIIGIFIFIILGFPFVWFMGVKGLLYALLFKSLVELCVILAGLARFLDIGYFILFRYKVNDFYFFKKILKFFRV
jgi:O-antigen/teichoic acid export membrane protein